MLMLRMHLVLGLTLASNVALGEELPSWLTGHWCRNDDGARIEERWLPASANRMLGVSETLASGRSHAFEFLRIERDDDGAVDYLAQPGGRPPTTFRATIVQEHHARFENPDHDFPQVIEYRRDGKRLTATIAGPGENGQHFEIPFAFERCDGHPVAD